MQKFLARKPKRNLIKDGKENFLLVSCGIYKGDRTNISYPCECAAVAASSIGFEERKCDYLKEIWSL